MEKRLIETADGSHTIEWVDLQESYHSINGAWSESMHVFIDQGFRKVLPCINPVKVLEIGFGSGLNAFQTYLEVHEGSRKVHYVGLEPYPVSKPIWSILNYPDFAGCSDTYPIFAQLHQNQWDVPVFIGENFILHKMNNRLEDVGFSAHAFHLIYFDAFSPGKQQELWTREVMDRMYKALMPGGILVTYVAKGEVRRILEDVGFDVERLPGAPGKREMLRATKPLRKENSKCCGGSH